MKIHITRELARAYGLHHFLYGEPIEERTVIYGRERNSAASVTSAGGRAACRLNLRQFSVTPNIEGCKHFEPDGFMSKISN